MQFPCPDENGLKRLIAEAFDALPMLEPARLDQIGRELGQKAQRTKKANLPWWAIGLLAFGGTAAAWWGIKEVREFLAADTKPETSIEQPLPNRITPDKTGDAKKMTEDTQENKTETVPAAPVNRKSPIIYQNENY